MHEKVDGQLNLSMNTAADDYVASQYVPEARTAIVLGDTLDVCAALPSSHFQLVITSPPYNLGKQYERAVKLEDYIGWQAAVVSDLVRVLRPGGSLCWQVGNYVLDGEVFPLDVFFYPIIHGHGLKLRNRLIWHFDHGLHASRRFSGRYETLLWFTKGEDYTFNLDSVRVPSKYPGKLHFKGDKRGKPSGNPLGKNPSDYWRFLSDEWEGGVLEIPNVKANHAEKTCHPCQFPVELVERCVLALTNEDDWVLDPFGGVGSTAVAAAKNNRRAVSIDRDEGYCDIARERLTMLKDGRLKLRALGKPVHQPSGREKIVQIPMEWSK
jgi:adenine-specific DNA-methyltransferase